MHNDISGPMLTVIMPVRDRAALLPRTLLSIERQTLRPLNIVIADNGSTDSSPEIIEQWRQRVEPQGIHVTVVSEPRPGAAAARNAALAKVTTPFTLHFDSDDEMMPDHLAMVDAYLRRNPATQILRWDVKIMDEEGWTTLKSVDDEDLLRGHILHAALATQRYAVATDLLRSVGGWDETLTCWDDLELGTRLLAHKPATAYLRCEPRVVIHPSDDSITGRRYADRHDAQMQALEACRRALRHTDSEEATVWLDAKRMILAGNYAREGEPQLAERTASAILDAAAGRGRAVRMKLQLVRLAVTIAGHGGCALAKWLLQPRAKAHRE